MPVEINRNLPPPPPGRIVPLVITPDGWAIATIHWSLIPDYDYDDACKGMSDEAIARELEVDWSATVGKRVYPQFGRSTHVAVRNLPFDPKRKLYCGWDFGGHPAFVPTQLAATGQWYVYPALAPPPEETWGIYEFAKEVADYLEREYAMPHGLTLKDLDMVHIGDPAGAAKPPRVGDSPKEERSCFDILNKGVEVIVTDELGRNVKQSLPGWGWKVVPGAVNITDRLEGVRGRLLFNIRGGVPSIIVDPRATSIIEGFLGGYCYKQRGDGRYDYDPDKNWYSHIFDAFGYIATRLFSAGDAGDKKKAGGKSGNFRSHAARRSRS